MKTLLLASDGETVTDGGIELRGRKIRDLRIAYITTAGKDVPNTEYIDVRRARMRELGMKFEEMDIDGKDEDTLRMMFRGFDVVYVEGGNTFYLLKAVRGSGFEKVMKEYIAAGMIYIGTSAGAYIACPTIEMATWFDLNKFNCHRVIDFTALNLVPFLVSVHYDPQYRDLLKEKIAQNRYPVRILKDGQALLIEDDAVRLIGDEPEVVV